MIKYIHRDGMVFTNDRLPEITRVSPTGCFWPVSAPESR